MIPVRVNPSALASAGAFVYGGSVARPDPFCCNGQKREKVRTGQRTGYGVVATDRIVGERENVTLNGNEVSNAYSL